MPLTSLFKSTYYHPHERKQKISNAKLLTLILKIKKHNLGYGYPRVTDQLHRLGHKINHKRVQRIMSQNKIISQEKFIILELVNMMRQKAHKVKKLEIDFIENLKQMGLIKKLSLT